MVDRVRAAGTVLCLASLLSVTAVLFSDLLPGPFGGYADQRFLLFFLSGILLIGSILFLPTSPGINWSRGMASLLPVLLMSFFFLILATPFIGRPFLWVEPGMYAIYFLAIGFAGFCLSVSGFAAKYAYFLVSTAAIGSFFYGAMSINVYLFALSDNVSNLVNFLPWGFVNIRYWSHIATWLIPLLPLAVLIGPLKKWQLWRFGVAIGAGIWWWMILLSSARGSMVGLVFGVVLVVALLGREAVPWLKVFFRYLLIGIITWLILSVLIPSFVVDESNVRTFKTDSSGRLPLFVEAWRMSLKNFPFGMGPQSWLTHEAITDSYRDGRKFGHPHNMYLMWAAEYGWLLIAGAGAWVWQAIRNLRKSCRTSHQGGPTGYPLLLAGFIASVAAAMVHASVSAVFMAPGSMLIGLFVLITFFGLIQRVVGADAICQISRNSRTSNSWALTFAGIVLIGWFALGWEVWVYHEAMADDQAFYQDSVSEGTLPRFWFHGNFPRGQNSMP